MLLTMAQVRQLITIKVQSAAEVATIWLTTAEMGFSLTAKPNEVMCPKDAREGKVSDRFLAPAISRFATSVLARARASEATLSCVGILRCGRYAPRMRVVHKGHGEHKSQ